MNKRSAPMQSAFATAGLVAFTFTFTFTVSGCLDRHACSDVGYYSGARITLHLPPADGIFPPETVTACRQPECMSATLPPIPDTGASGVTFASLDGTPAMVTGFLTLRAGGLRVLDIAWTVNDIQATDPSDSYSVAVKDAEGEVTGSLAGKVTYNQDEPNGDGCGIRWFATVTD